MVNYDQFPEPGSLSIGEAIAAGKQDIQRRAAYIAVGLSAAGIIAACCGLSLWFCAAGIVAGLAGAGYHIANTTPRWRIWAYTGVADIHQFQRCAELADLLPKQSPYKSVGITGPTQDEQLAALQQRFDEDPPFIDDPEVLQISHLYERSMLPRSADRPLITITREGISTRDLGFIPWSDIWNEHIGIKSFSAGYPVLPLPLLNRDGGAFLCFSCSRLMFEMPVTRLAIGPAALEQILYIHRGRYESDVAGGERIVPLLPSRPEPET